MSDGELKTISFLNQKKVDDWIDGAWDVGGSTILREISENSANIRLEAHIKHPIRLIKNEISISQITYTKEWEGEGGIPNAIETNAVLQHGV